MGRLANIVPTLGEGLVFVGNAAADLKKTKIIWKKQRPESKPWPLFFPNYLKNPLNCPKYAKELGLAKPRAEQTRN